MPNKGYEEVGKGFIALSNLISVLYLLNNVLSLKKTADTGDFILAIIILAFCFVLYLAGYKMIRDSQGSCNG